MSTLMQMADRIVNEMRDSKSGIMALARAMSVELLVNGQDPGASRILPMAAAMIGAQKSHVNTEASFSAFNRPFLPWIKKFPNRETEGFHREFAEASRSIHLRVDEAAFKASCLGQWDDYTKSLDKERIDKICSEGRDFVVNLQCGSSGRFYANGSYSHQGSKTLRSCVRFKQPYAITESKLLDAFEHLRTKDAQNSYLTKPPQSEDGVAALNEYRAYSKAMQSLDTHTDFIKWVDMSASGIWIIALMVGDHHVFKALKSGDFYTETLRAYPELSGLSKKTARNYIKVVILLTAYSSMGRGLAESLYNNHPELFQEVWDYFGMGSQDDMTECKKFGALQDMFIQRFLQTYPGVAAYREWALKYGMIGKEPPKYIEWTLGGFKAFTTSWGWRSRQSREEREQVPANAIELIGRPTTPLAEEYYLPLSMDLQYSSPHGNGYVTLPGREFGWGHKTRSFCPVAVHSIEAAVVGRTALDIIRAGSPALTVHDAGGCRIGYEHLWNEGFAHHAPMFVREFRQQFKSMPNLGTIRERDLKDLKIFR